MEQNQTGRRTRVDLLVLGQVVVADEGFPALVALVALVVVVDAEVEPVGAAVAEALAADAAQVGLLSAVDPQVLLQRRPVGRRSCRSVRLHTDTRGRSKPHLSLTDFPQMKQVHFLLPPCVHSMCLFLLPVSLNWRPQISQGNGPKEETKRTWGSFAAPRRTAAQFELGCTRQRGYRCVT